MKSRLKQYWFNVRNSLWFLPTVMALSAVVLALGLIELDHHVTYDDFPFGWFIYGGQQDGARSVLSTVASSMVTIAGVTLSITLVALTMASSQFGPRLLRNFISDKGNQFVIGTFISTFIYSLIVLLTIRGSGDDEFIPKISIVFAFLLAVMSLGVIIYFIHHVTTSIQADFVIRSSYADFQRLVDDYFLSGDKQQKEGGEAPGNWQEAYALSTKLCFDSSGFIQNIDYQSAYKWAEKNNAVVEWLICPGDFGTVYQPFAILHYKSSLPENTGKQFINFFVLGYKRTPNQDLLFSLKQIVEVGVRALSPGINDPHTAITCIQWLGSALSVIAKRKSKSDLMKGVRGNIRVIVKQVSCKDIVDTCFDQLLIYARSNLLVIDQMLRSIKKPMAITTSEEMKGLLKLKAAEIYRQTQQNSDSADLQRIELLYREIMHLDN